MPTSSSKARLVLAALISLAFVACGSASSSPSPSSPSPSSSSSSNPPSSKPGDDLTVALSTGKVQGDLVDKTRRFLKIPYAKPPTGDLRWKAPVAPDPWSGVRHETAFASPCPQNASSQGAASTDEDCLYLNIWTPEPGPTKAPVMIWIHGGGNFAGSSADTVPVVTPAVRWYDGKVFAARHGMVLVTANYRLGPMGFFPHPALANEHSPVGNQGLLDQRMVMQWVKSNIVAFGGDPTNVTIFGESAGSSDVCYHVASPGSRGLFDRAVSESGGCTTSLAGGKDVTAAGAATGMAAFTKAMSCDTATDPLACLRGKSTSEIMANANQPNPMAGLVAPSGVWTFPVVVDGPGGFLPDQARALYDSGNVAHVPYILGSNTDEGTLFLLDAPAVGSEAQYQSALQMQFGSISTQVEAVYPASNFNGDFHAALARAIGDSGLVCGTHDTARRAAKAGLQVFMYNFNIPWNIGLPSLGVSHASEIGHVFGDPVKPDAASQAVSDAMNAFWAHFATAGDPNVAGSPATWPPFAPTATDDDKRLQLDPGWEILDDFRKDECAFWRQQYDAAFAAL